MPAAPLPPDESIRLQTLRSLEILDTPSEERFDRLTRMSQHIFQAPISLLTLIDEKRQWFKSQVGMEKNETDRSLSICAYVIHNDEGIIVPDAQADARFSDNALVTGDPGIRAYAGMPLTMPNGCRVGTLCVIDTVPRQFTESQLQALRDLASIAADELAKTELNEALGRLHYLASHDNLTGLLNRAGFESLMQAVLEETEAGSPPSAVIYLDLDNFKILNDSLGHSAGDKLLIQVADVLRQTENSAAARMGGDEFALLLRHQTLTQARRTGEALRQRLDDYVFSMGAETKQVSASLGLAVLEENPADTLCRADTACYLAKSRGRNRLEIQQVEPAEIKTLRDDVGWQRRIRDALRNDTLVLWFQPIQEITTGRITHCEALIRLCDLEDEVFGPAAFLPAIERFKMAPDLDRYVLRHAVRHLVEEPRLNLAINLSGSAFADPNLIVYIQTIFHDAGIDPARVTLEITEREVIGNLLLAKALIANLTNLGFQFALDDFGSGFSSFSYLKMLPVSTLKIDGSFIRDLRQDASNRVFVRAMNEIAHFFEIKSLAEFVEDEITLEILKDIGIDYAQGYHVGKPSPIPILSR
jgi:Amt family ammonium transporter